MKRTFGFFGGGCEEAVRGVRNRNVMMTRYEGSAKYIVLVFIGRNFAGRVSLLSLLIL